MVNKLIRWAVTMLMVAALCFAFYEVGHAHDLPLRFVLYILLQNSPN